MNRECDNIALTRFERADLLVAKTGFLRDFGVRQPDGSYQLKSSDTSLFASIVQAGGEPSV